MVDRGGHDAVLQRQHAGHGLDATGATQQVTGHRFGGAHRDLQGPFARGTLDCRGFVLVVRQGAGAVGVDVVDLGWINAAIGHGQAHGFGTADAAGGGGGDVVCVAGHAVTHHFAEDRGATGLGMLEVSSTSAGTFTDHEAIALFIERTAGRGWIVVAERQGLGTGEAGLPG